MSSPNTSTQSTDLAIIGAGAAGLMAAIWAGRTRPAQRIVVLDGAAKLGAKILVAGGGRCNVTHHAVTEAAYAGSTPNAIKKVLRRFDVPQTVDFFAAQGVTLKREETGKLFPTTDKARTVLDALLTAARDVGVELRHPCRVETLVRDGERFVIGGDWGQLAADSVILATGGKSIPKSGSDGHGYTLATGFGHTLTPHILPALVPLTLPKDHFVRALSGITLPTTLDLWSASGKRLHTFTNSTLCTHFGLSGPSVLDMSRYYLMARREESAELTINWLPQESAESIDQQLQTLDRRTVGAYLRRQLPDRLAQALCDAAAVDSATTGDQLRRDDRLRLLQTITRCPLPIAGDRGYNYAEVTAGGVPLRELNLKTMESRVCPDLYLCGEICDVDGQIGGFNFQWAWASGYVAGVSV